jgi:hypothetical protein
MHDDQVMRRFHTGDILTMARSYDLPSNVCRTLQHVRDASCVHQFVERI